MALKPWLSPGAVRRIVRTGRDPVRGGAATGRRRRQDGGDVRHASRDGDGALAGIGFRRALEPVWPSRLEPAPPRIAASADRTLRVAAVADLAALGVDGAHEGSFAYAATRAVAAAAHVLEFDGLLVPGARAPGANLVVFLDRLGAGARLTVRRTEPVDWPTWRARARPALKTRPG